MKPRCPVCAGPSIEEREEEPRFECGLGHRFDRCAALVSVEEAIVLAKALDHPTRRGIIFAFGDKDEWSALELTERLGVPTPHHVKVLREAEPPILVESRQAKRRGATELFYRVNPRLLDGTRGAG